MSRLPRLNRTLVEMYSSYPAKVLQVGEGNFIRAFVDWMFHKCNEQNLFQGRVIVSQPISRGGKKLSCLNEQDGLYSVVVRGLVDDEPYVATEIVGSIARAIDVYEEWEDFLRQADDPAIEFICSNTTEAGIVYVKQEYDASHPQQTFPARLTLYMHRRYRQLGEEYGLTIIPCELLERAGDVLKEIVVRHAQDWSLDKAFIHWIEERNMFVNGLVDRIVTGYPADEAEAISQSLGYQDLMMTVAEPYYQWVLEDQNGLSDKLPFQEAGLNVLWVDDLSPYVKRKVRILNGAHTFLVPMAYLQGYDIVRHAMQDEQLVTKVRAYLDEIVSSVLPFSREETAAYIDTTISRFRNPFIDHKLLDIALNSISKSVTRLRSTLVDYMSQTNELPGHLMESYAYLFRFYRPIRREGQWMGWRCVAGERQWFELRDNTRIIEGFAAEWEQYNQDQDMRALVKRILVSDRIWEKPFTELAWDTDLIAAKISENLAVIMQMEELALSSSEEEA